MHKLIFISFFLLLSTVTSSQVDLIKKYNAYNLHPPMKINMVLSGNFGELRSNHFHTGIDVKTNGQTGFKMYTILEGHISRIKISPWGYGKAIYIDHPNGLTTVYAHCEDFPEKINDFINKAQYQLEENNLDLYPGKGELPVNKGEMIAYSGNSGSSFGPHLHFEIRDTKTEEPLNPLLFNFDIQDDISPDIQGVYLYSLSADGYEKELPETYINATLIENKYILNNNDPIELSADFFDQNGQLGIGVHAIDRLNGASNKCGLHKVTLKHEGAVIHTQNMSRLSFLTNRFINAHMDPYAYSKLRKNIHKLYISPYNLLPIYNNTLDGKTILNGQSNFFEIVVQDAYGNTSVLQFKIKLPKKGSLDIYPLNEKDFIFPDKNVWIDSNDFSVQIPSGTVYEPMKMNFNYTVENEIPKLTIGESEPPVHQYFNVNFNIPEKWKSIKDKIVVTRDRGRYWGSEGGYVLNDRIEARVRDFGSFSLAIDTTAPTIISSQLKDDYLTQESNTYQFKISDNLSGTKSVVLKINGTWHPLAYFPKKGYYAFTMPKVVAPKEFDLVLTVEDSKGNSTIQTIKLQQ